MSDNWLEDAATSKSYYLSGVDQVVTFLKYIAAEYNIGWPIAINRTNIEQIAARGYRVGRSVARLNTLPNRRLLLMTKDLDAFTWNAWKIHLPAFEKVVA